MYTVEKNFVHKRNIVKSGIPAIAQSRPVVRTRDTTTRGVHGIMMLSMKAIRYDSEPTVVVVLKFQRKLIFRLRNRNQFRLDVNGIITHVLTPPHSTDFRVYRTNQGPIQFKINRLAITGIFVPLFISKARVFKGRAQRRLSNYTLN